MDFINWDAAGAETGFDLGLQSPTAEGVTNQQQDDTNMNLVLGDVDGDDFSYWALEHFDSTQMPQDLTMTSADDTFGPLPVEPLGFEPPLPAQMSWEFPEAPCSHCRSGGYECKRIREGSYKGYCTSCVALRCECSFGPKGNHAGAEAGATFPANPWPTMGDRPETSILHEDELAALSNRTVNVSQPGPTAEAETQYPTGKPAAKIGARFSRESVRILKNWVSTHSRHPYPSEDEKESLQKITGLNKTQITNWLANARRRGKIQPTRSTSPHVGMGYAQAMDIPRRPGTPRSMEHMNPLQRWANSPPENEPASVTAIARAVTASSGSAISSSSGRNTPVFSGFSDDGSSKSLCNQSSASSFSNSHGSSGGSFASTFSHQSRGSFGSLPSFARNHRGRRRRRRAPPKRAEEAFAQPLKTFQCTFCTETFRTKHDWQRHEKSLHLSLERWVCSPDGAKAVNPVNGVMSCVFCGEANPDDAHIESHNFTACTERTLEERTFYRKDHLRQHLKLVHDVKFLPWAMDQWRVNTPSIRSRCGFCGTVMDSWSIRVDHLAEHFKTGYTMADWKGDWGFDAPVLEMVENSVPPYLIHDERNSALPFTANTTNPSTPRDAYELLKLELTYWAQRRNEETGRSPTDDELQQEACRIVFSADITSSNVAQASSWLRDLIKGRSELTQTAMLQPIRKSSENELYNLRINGKDNIFENCEFESQLQDFVKARQLLGLTAMDHELQTEACKIIGRIEEKSSSTSEDVANWLVRLILTSTTWLADFRKRAHLPRSEDIVAENVRGKDPMLIDSTVHNFSRLDRELAEFMQTQRSMGLEPTDADLQLQARLIIYDEADDWNQTAADDAAWLVQFRQRHPPLNTPVTISPTNNSPNSQGLSFMPALQPAARTPAGTNSSPGGFMPPPRSMRPGPFFLNDANCYQRLAKHLGRFVATTMSPNNPNCHIPSDEELQHQARWIVYDDDDPWNQTAADNAEWLQRFKRDAGILQTAGPGLTQDVLQWNVTDGGTGFAPPYVCLSPQVTLEPLQENPKIFCREESKPFEPDAATANRYLKTLNQRYAAPAKVFCSRELESGLTEYVKREVSKTGVLPSDDELRDRARQIMSMQKTAADDPTLLEKFKAAIQPLVLSQQEASIASMATTMFPATTNMTAPALPAESQFDFSNTASMSADMTLSDEQVSYILGDIDLSTF